MNRGVFLEGLMKQLSRFHVRKILLLPSVTSSQVYKTCFPAVSELNKDTPRVHCVISWDKKSRESVLWMLIAITVVILIRWNCTVRWLPSKKWQAAYYFQKTQIHDQSCFNEERNEPECFPGKFEAAMIQVSRGKILLLPSGPSSQVHKNMFCAFSEWCMGTTGTQCTIRWEKMAGYSVLCVLTNIPLVTLIR